MNFRRIEDEALHLPEDDEPRPNGFEDQWLIEARRRAKEIDEGLVKPIPAEQVRRKARELLR